MDNADPVQGWLFDDVDAASRDATTADVYGKLFRYVHQTLSSFLNRLETVTANFHLFHNNAAHLPVILRLQRFDRIEVTC